MLRLDVEIDTQKMFVYDDDKLIKSYLISTAKNGPGELHGSEKTPHGLHIIRAKTGEIYTPEMKYQFPNRDWILTRILWLSGMEKGKNRLREVDTMRRYIYIHGTPDEVEMGKPGSKGCIRMRNKDIIELYDLVPVRTH